MPCLQHRAIFSDAILTLPRLLQCFGVDALDANEHAIYPGLGPLFNEAADLVCRRIDLSDYPERKALVLSHSDQPVENRFPGLVTGEVVVGDEKIVHAL